jgi:hypothetical protein
MLKNAHIIVLGLSSMLTLISSIQRLITHAEMPFGQALKSNMEKISLILSFENFYTSNLVGRFSFSRSCTASIGAPEWMIFARERKRPQSKG